jgi:UDP-N-acetylmuramate--alanine ligase
MHIFFSGIGGSGIGPLAQIAKQAGYDVSGSDAQESVNTELLKKDGIDFYIGQSASDIAELHARKPIDWLVVTSSITRTNPNHPELVFAEQHGIKVSKRDELLGKIIADQNLKLIGIAGTHGKSTTTAMVTWLFDQLGIPFGHSVGAKLSFAPMGRLQPGAQYFVYECDEFDNNFLAFHPYYSVITGISWDHHEIFPTRESYISAYTQFLKQSDHTLIWQEDVDHLGLEPSESLCILDSKKPEIEMIALPGEYNRQDAWQAVLVTHKVTGKTIEELTPLIDRFPGLKQRMEELAPNLYSNYAHTPEKIKGGMLTALELAKPKRQKVVVLYEPLTNRRQHFIKNDYKDCFAGADHIYWLPTYLAREDPAQEVLTPAQLIPYITNAEVAEPAELDEALRTTIQKHLDAGDMVVLMGASGAGSADEWLRKQFVNKG